MDPDRQFLQLVNEKRRNRYEWNNFLKDLNTSKNVKDETHLAMERNLKKMVGNIESQIEKNKDQFIDGTCIKTHVLVDDLQLKGHSEFVKRTLEDTLKLPNIMVNCTTHSNYFRDEYVNCDIKMI